MLNMEPVVQVNVSVGANTVPVGVFDVGAILTTTAGTGTSLSTDNRYAVYESLAEVASGVSGFKPAFDTTTDVYKAAAKYFGVSPAPARLIVIYYASDPVAPAYDAAKTYSQGDYCTHETKIYQANQDIATAEEWTSAHWTEVPFVTDTPATALTAAVTAGAEFYGVYYSIAPSSSADDYKTKAIAVVSALDSMNRGVLFYGVVGSASDITTNGAIMQAMSASGTRRAVGLACTASADDAAGLMGIAMGYGRSSANRAFALCYKPVTSATLNNYSQSEVDTIKGVNGNVYVARTRTRGGIENGATASGMRYDEVLYIDRMVSEIQSGLYTTIADNPTKLPQTDSTTTLFISEISRILEAYYDIGVLADSVWRGTVYDGMEEDMIIDHGYYAFARSFEEQSAADRALHKAMPITVLICFSGSVESIVINLDVQT